MASFTLAIIVLLCLSLKSQTLNAFIGRSCLKGFYCGHEVSEVEDLVSDSLYKCSNVSGEPMLSVDRKCRNGCIIAEESHCNVSCISGRNYCGHELAGFDFEAKPNNSLYSCNDYGTNFMYLQTCDLTCIESKNSSCKQSCISEKHYCGYELEDLGWKVETSSLQKIFSCTANGTGVIHIRTCTQCGIRSEGPYCSLLWCHQGYHYCGHQLEGWTNMEAHSLYWCVNSTRVNKIKSCKQCQNSTVKSYCREGCVEGALYCGHELGQWTEEAAVLEEGRHLNSSFDFSNKTLYKCSGDGTNFSHVQTCKGTCRISSRYSVNSFCFQDCEPGRYYCGRELASLEAWNMQSPHFERIYLCGKDKLTYITSCELGCISGREGAYCMCAHDLNYCGHELLSSGYRWTNLEANSLYTCNRRIDVNLVKQCNYGCIGSTGNSFCAQRYCEPGRYYCQHELEELESSNTISTQLQNTFHLQCINNVSAKVINHCSECVNRQDTVTCTPWCSDGKLYCGHELQLLKWNNVTEHSLYWCAGGTIREIQSCLQCQNSGVKSYCLDSCVKSALYCGHELNQWNNGASVLQTQDSSNDVSSNELYRCSGGGTNFVHVQTCKGRCAESSLNSFNAFCNQDCEPGRSYCGHELVKMESWNTKAEQFHQMFLCESDGHGTSLIKKCKECVRQQKSSRNDVSCLSNFICSGGTLYCGSKLPLLPSGPMQPPE